MRCQGDTIFGDRADFAIEAGAKPDLAVPSAVWGHMRVWCQGVPFGNFEDRSCAIYLAYVRFKWLAAHVHELWDDSLAGLSDPERWGLLQGALYGFHGNGISVPKTVVLPNDREADRAWERYNKFVFLTNWGAQFDGFRAFLLSPPDAQCRVLFRAGGTGAPTGIDVSRAGIVSASNAFVAWFEMQEERLSGRTA
jgi:hypothetical protein